MDKAKIIDEYVEISVIVPVFNSEKYLAHTVKSILRQDFPSFEIVLVDDGSTDGSGELCDTIAKDDPRVRVIHKKNGGVCSARNVGIREAHGKYIAFADNDDEFLPNLLKDNYSLLKEYKADIVRFSRVWRTTRRGRIVGEEKTNVVNGNIPSDRFFSRIDDALSAGYGVWAGIYSADFLKKNTILFDESMYYGFEDMDFIMQVFLNSPNIVLNAKTYYIWEMRYEHSTSWKANKNGLESLLVFLHKEEKLLNRAHCSEVYRLERLMEGVFLGAKYINPIKVKMEWSTRKSWLEAFLEDSVFTLSSYSRESIQELKKRNLKKYVLYYMHSKKMISLMIITVSIGQLIAEWRRGFVGFFKKGRAFV